MYLKSGIRKNLDPRNWRAAGMLKRTRSVQTPEIRKLAASS